MPRPSKRKRPKDIDAAYVDIPPYTPLDTAMDFYIPPVLEADFNRW